MRGKFLFQMESQAMFKKLNDQFRIIIILLFIFPATEVMQAFHSPRFLFNPYLNPILWVIPAAEIPGQQNISTDKDSTTAELPIFEHIDIIINAPRLEIPLQENPAATTIIEPALLEDMPKTVAADEALKLVPGVKVDNQADGERVHLSIRGQGILTERGVRGIKTLVDGLPLNDPTGFVPDFFDIDWATVCRIEVLRGPAAALYGSGSSGGIINIKTMDGASVRFGGQGVLSVGSYGFMKSLLDIGGTAGALNYRISGSHSKNDGYRDHTAFRANNFYSKFNLEPSAALHLTLILAWTDFFNQNAEGLNLTWLAQDRRMANPDAITYNEYQRTKRFSGGITGKYSITHDQELAFSSYYRKTGYKEAVPSSVQHRSFVTPGFAVQYTHQSHSKLLTNRFSAGADLDLQSINEFRHPNLGRASEGPELLSDQTIQQRGLGLYLLDRLEFGPNWGIMVNIRYDQIKNELQDKLKSEGVDLSDMTTFTKMTGRLGISWNTFNRLSLYANWGMGFLPPATEELTNNPDSPGGFNRHLQPATSRGEEVGLRSILGNNCFLDAAVFYLHTDKDFGRYRVSDRPLETFYGNMGSSNRYGLEALVNWYPARAITINLAYTYSYFKYVTIKTLTSPAELHDTYLPNSPQHQVYLDFQSALSSKWQIGFSTEIQSRSYIDPTNASWTNGYTLLHGRISYHSTFFKNPSELILSARNILGEKYIAFTEPDPDGNSYQPAPTAEVILTLRVYWNKP
jgi:iron complex outermembrane receptor protein